MTSTIVLQVDRNDVDWAKLGRALHDDGNLGMTRHELGDAFIAGASRKMLCIDVTRVVPPNVAVLGLNGFAESIEELNSKWDVPRFLRDIASWLEGSNG